MDSKVFMGSADSQNHKPLRKFSFFPALDFSDGASRAMLPQAQQQGLSDDSERPVGAFLRLVATQRQMELAELMAGFRAAVRRMQEAPKYPPPLELDE